MISASSEDSRRCWFCFMSCKIQLSGSFYLPSALVSKRTACLVGNSSVGVRECSFLGIPVVNIGSRQAGRDRGGNLLDVSYDRRQIAGAIRHHLGNGRYQRETIYGDGRAGERIAQVLSTTPLRIEKRLTY